VTDGPVTTEEILDVAEQRTGLTRPQLLVLVAKSATVRHLATHEKYKNLFVLKGGTLLSSVYRSPRQSIADADYTYLDPENLKVPNLEEALAANGERVRGAVRAAWWTVLGGKHRGSEPS